MTEPSEQERAERLAGALREIAQARCSCHDNHDPNWHSETCVVAKAQAALSGTASGWVSVKERLPEDLQIVLVWWIHPDGDAGTALGFWSVEHETWDVPDVHSAKLVVTHWRELPPAPPTGESNG